jgi:hypothetical protein
MSCEIYRNLEYKRNLAKAEWRQFALSQNSHLWGTTAATAKRIASSAKRKWFDLERKMTGHAQGCPHCLAARDA